MKYLNFVVFISLAFLGCRSRSYSSESFAAETESFAIVRFGEDMQSSPSISGTLRTMQSFKVEYDRKRFLSLGMKCDFYNGIPLCPTTKAYARCLNAQGEVISQSNKSGDHILFDIPTKTRVIEIWFEGISYSGVGNKIDSNHGKNYRFLVETY